jgi:hypothetical protein
MQVVLQSALDELFTFSDPAKRIGAMLLFETILAKVKATAPTEHATFLASMKSDPNVSAEVAKAKAELEAAKETLSYWDAVSS